MTYYYQLLFLGDTEQGAYKEIRGQFMTAIREFGMDESCVKIIKADSFDIDYSNSQPTFAFFFGDAKNRNRDLTILTKLLSHGDTIYPIYFRDGDFEQEMPDCIHAINGHQYKEEDVHKFVNCALESFRLLRKTRKVFISYRRKDSMAVANQLFDVLTRRNFDVFLDTYAISGAENFQEELFHRMSDCDVLIQLNTTDFKNSKWCKAEVEMANMKQIGLVEIIWPNSKLEKWSDLCHPYYLKADDFRHQCFRGKKPLLETKVLNDIARDVESVRARNLAARQDNITGEFVQEANKVGKQVVKELYYLIETLADRRQRLFLPTVGIPSSFDYYESLEFRTLLNNDRLEIYLLYDELRIRDRWISHLDWLDSSLEVKTIKKKDFEIWIRNH